MIVWGRCTFGWTLICHVTLRRQGSHTWPVCSFHGAEQSAVPLNIRHECIGSQKLAQQGRQSSEYESFVLILVAQSLGKGIVDKIKVPCLKHVAMSSYVLACMAVSSQPAR